MTDRDVVDVDQLPAAVRATSPLLVPSRERRRQIADELYNAIVTGGYSFWDHIYPLFLSRDITRHDMRELVRRGLATTRGNYRALLKLFGMAPGDYKRFLNFLAAHECRADFREFRNGRRKSADVRSWCCRRCLKAASLKEAVRRRRQCRLIRCRSLIANSRASGNS
jgi:hypothetical protein